MNRFDEERSAEGAEPLSDSVRLAFACRLRSADLRRRAWKARRKAAALREARARRCLADASPLEFRFSTPSESDASLATFIALRDDAAVLEGLEDHLREALDTLRQERSILSVEAEALGRRLREAA